MTSIFQMRKLRPGAVKRGGGGGLACHPHLLGLFLSQEERGAEEGLALWELPPLQAGGTQSVTIQGHK